MYNILNRIGKIKIKMRKSLINKNLNTSLRGEIFKFTYK